MHAHVVSQLHGHIGDLLLQLVLGQGLVHCRGVEIYGVGEGTGIGMGMDIGIGLHVKRLGLNVLQ